MKNKIGLVLVGMLLTGSIFYTGCYSDQFEPEPIIIDPVDTISFSAEILPIFVASCNQSICHGPGAVPPDLTPSKAYNSLINGDFINTSDPVASDLYLWLIGDGGRIVMPPSGKDDALIELTLGWMQQGALNN